MLCLTCKQKLCGFPEDKNQSQSATRNYPETLLATLEITQKNMNGDQNGGYSYGVRGKEGERIFEFCAAMNITV